MKRKEPKAEPSLRDKLAQKLDAALEADFAINGAAAIEALRNKSVDKYVEIAARRVAATDPPANSFESAHSMEEIGIRLLESVGTPRDLITESMIQAAIDANDAFIKRLGQIAADAQGGLN